MRLNKTQLFNACLSELGLARIDAANSSDPYAVECQDAFDTERVLLLGETPWAFARMRAKLAKLLTPPVFGYANAFALPDTCIHVLPVSKVNGVVYANEDKKWDLEQGMVYSDSEEFELEYIGDVTQVEKYPGYFFDALSVKMAIRMSGRVLGAGARKSLLTRYGMLLRGAKSKNGKEQSYLAIPRTSEYIQPHNR